MSASTLPTRTIRATLASVAMILVAQLALAGAAQAQGAVHAHNDAVSMTVGATVKLDVLANDRIGTAAATVLVTGVPVADRHGLSVGMNRRQEVVIRTFSSTTPGRYTVTYKAVDAKGRRDAARVVITVARD